jgi:hypothetical protein
MTIYLLVVVMCATSDPAISDCQVVYAAPVEVADEMSCNILASRVARRYFKPVRELPFLSAVCRTFGQES